MIVIPPPVLCNSGAINNDHGQLLFGATLTTGVGDAEQRRSELPRHSESQATAVPSGSWGGGVSGGSSAYPPLAGPSRMGSGVLLMQHRLSAVVVR